MGFVIMACGCSERDGSMMRASCSRERDGCMV